MSAGELPNTVEVWGDQIRVDGAAVATLDPHAPGFVRDRFEKLLRISGPLIRGELISAEDAEEEADDLASALASLKEEVGKLAERLGEINEEVGNEKIGALLDELEALAESEE